MVCVLDETPKPRAETPREGQPEREQIKNQGRGEERWGEKSRAKVRVEGDKLDER